MKIVEVKIFTGTPFSIPEQIGVNKNVHKTIYGPYKTTITLLKMTREELQTRCQIRMCGRKVLYIIRGILETCRWRTRGKKA